MLFKSSVITSVNQYTSFESASKLSFESASKLSFESASKLSFESQSA